MEKSDKTINFIQKAKEKFNINFNYSKVEYINQNTPVIITCPQHGEFSIKPKTFLERTFGCTQCLKDQELLKYKNEFLNKFKLIHNNYYDYSSVDYKGNNVKIEIICPKHGPFWQTPDKHLKNKCPSCSKYNKNNNSIIQRFFIKSKEIHKNKYTYDKSVYKDYKTNMIITCPVHGDFEQKPYNHIKGAGCNKCRIDSRKLDLNSFIKKANQIHNFKFNYDKVEFNTSQDVITITCPIHGDFKQQVYSHLQDKGCRLCSIENSKDTLTDFIIKANKIHNSKYDYSKSNYINSKQKIEIICPEHGSFWQVAGQHINGYGCKECSKYLQTSKKEKVLKNFFEEHDYEVIQSYKPQWLHNKELDIYVPELNLAIEYNGTIYHHSTENLSDYLNKSVKNKKYHLEKYNVCKQNGIDLIHIFEFEDFEEWLNILKQYIQNSDKYKIVYKNNHRFINYSNSKLDFYGESFIKLQASFKTQP